MLTCFFCLNLVIRFFSPFLFIFSFLLLTFNVLLSNYLCVGLPLRFNLASLSDTERCEARGSQRAGRVSALYYQIETHIPKARRGK
jgi:hypothetical protein